jgi:hypothetical protein
MLDECEWRASSPDSIYFQEEATLLSTMQDADWKNERLRPISLVAELSSFLFMEFDVYEEWNCIRSSQLLQAEESVLLIWVHLERSNLTLDRVSEKTQGDRKYSAK